MKRFLKLTAITGSMLLFGATVWAGHQTFEGYRVIHVVVNGKSIQSDVPAINFNGRTMLPVRAVAEALGAEVGWDPATSTATLTMVASAGISVSGPGSALYSQEGHGPQTTKILELAVGTYVVNMTHDGKSNFIVTPYTVGGDRVASIANVIGSYDGSALLVIRSAGRYLIQVNADGNWTMSISKAE